MYSFSMWQFYMGMQKWEEQFTCGFVFNYAIHWGILIFGKTKLEKAVHLLIRFLRGNSFGNTTMEITVHFWIIFQLGNSFGNIDMKRTIRVSICFQLGKSFGNTKMKRTFHLCIRFQLGSLFSFTLARKIFQGPSAIVSPNLLKMLLMFKG